MRSLLLCAFSLLLGVAYSKSINDAANKDDTLLKAKFKTRDTEGDGRISRSYLCALGHRHKNRADGGLTLDLVNLINNQFEADGEGRISKSDIRALGAGNGLSLDLVNLINDQIEGDGDGNVFRKDCDVLMVLRGNTPFGK